MSNHDPFQSIDLNALADVTGGAQAIASGGGSTTSDQLMQMMTQLQTSLQSMTQQSNGGMDPMTMMMMMMMMGGMGGGGGGAPAPAPAGYATGSSPANPIYIQVTRNGSNGDY